MTDAPEKIWAATGLYCDYVQDWTEGEWSKADVGDEDWEVSYTRTDLIPALEAAAYARGLEDAAKVAEEFSASVRCRKCGNPFNDHHYRHSFEGTVSDQAIAAAIRALGAKP